jgi:hypothetical protein
MESEDVGDANNDHLAEVYGAYRDFVTPVAFRIYGVDTSGQVTLLHDYGLNGGISTRLLDADANGLTELAVQRGDTMVFFEQPTTSALPTIRKSTHVMWQGGGGPIWTHVQFGYFDRDSLLDFLYRGSQADSVSGFVNRTYVAEYRTPSLNFERIWSTQLARVNESQLGGYTFGDYDRDGRIEFVASELFGNVHLVENMSDNSYIETWQDSLPFVNVYYQSTGDVDGDGKPELFVGATMSNGNWTTVFEADSDNHYSPKLIFHLLSGGSLDEPNYVATDVDGDGRLELVIFSGTNLFVFKSNSDNVYYLWYYKRENARSGIQFYDFNLDGRKDFAINKTLSNGQSLRFQADIYRAANRLSAGAYYAEPQNDNNEVTHVDR